MSRTALQQFDGGLQTLTANLTDKTIVLQPRVSGFVSRGIAEDQPDANVTNRTAVAAFSKTTLVDSVGGLWGTTAYVGHIAVIVSGTGAGEARVITSHTATTLTFDVPLIATPTGSTRFTIYKPDTRCPVATEWMVNHLTVVGTLLLQSSGRVNGALTTRTLGLYGSGAASSGFQAMTGAAFVGLEGGDLRITPSGALTGSTLVAGWWAGSTTDEIE